MKQGASPTVCVVTAAPEDARRVLQQMPQRRHPVFTVPTGCAFDPFAPLPSLQGHAAHSLLPPPQRAPTPLHLLCATCPCVSAYAFSRPNCGPFGAALPHGERVPFGQHLSFGCRVLRDRAIMEGEVTERRLRRPRQRCSGKPPPTPS